MANGTNVEKPRDKIEPGFANKRASIVGTPGFKLIVIGFLAVILMIPAMLVWGLVEERANNANRVSASIADGWGGPQIVNGPYLVVPFRVSVTQNNKTETRIRHAMYSPDDLAVSSDIDVNERQKSIYKSQLYHSKMKFSGRFKAVELKKILDQDGEPLLDRSFLVFEISDTSGFRSEVIAKLNNGAPVMFEPGTGGIGFSMPGKTNIKTRQMINSRGGVMLPINRQLANGNFGFAIEMALNGSRHFGVVPAGRTTKINLKSNWAHPGFEGRFLPEIRDINDKGFTASWTIPNLARGIESVLLAQRFPSSSSAIKINFVEPLKFYQVVSRTLKYAIAFFSLIFLTVFILEITGNSPVHWIQYLITGLALVVFYILLLALSEQIGFAWAYLTSSLATTGLIAWYVGDALGQQKKVAIMAGALGTSYLIMYLILNEDEYALLAGAVIAFTAIAVTMITTRNLDWSGKKQTAE